LSQAEAVELARLRFAVKKLALTEAHEAELIELVRAVEFHTMAFDIALSSLLRRRNPMSHLPRILTELREGKGFGELPLDESQRDGRVERSLARSYWELDEALQRRFRWLGCFAPAAPFTAAQAATLWECSPTEAEDTLTLFEEASLVRGEVLAATPIAPETVLWDQHSLLRLYGWALLRQAGEGDSAAARHASLFTALMRDAEDANQPHTMRPFVPQLRHAFTWAIKNNLALALNLISQTANLHAAFFELASEGFRWTEQALAAARLRGDNNLLAQALGSYGNALQRVATWPEQDRRARLLAALAAYDEALRFRQPDTAPLAYAMTQGNLVNLFLARAELPGEERLGRLGQALSAAWRAYSLFGQLQHEHYRQQAQRQLLQLRAACGDDFAALWAGLGAGALPQWLDTTDGGAEPAGEAATRALLAFLNSRSSTEEQRLLTEFPALLDAQMEPLLDRISEEYQDNEELLAIITRKRALLRACREHGVEKVFAQLRPSDAQAALGARFQEALNQYLVQQQSALEAGEQATVAQWQEVAAAGEALLGEEFTAISGINFEALRENIASTYNHYGTAHDNAGDKEAALLAFERAIALQPGFAMWRRNRVGMLIELGRPDEAEAELDRARDLEPEATRLPDLEAQLATARRGKDAEEA
ncbi:MAG: tetratricopeptide repeat protein, partial [Ardenticatenales bacterium]|nr:tetratricopeptide repeat protein [Ardenticatenales bacterium]